jgi:predicted amidohydrolase YtcJ
VNVPSLKKMTEAVAERAQRLPKGRWILGQGWLHLGWPEGKLPSRYDLDQAAPDHPVFLYHASLHSAVANSAALEFAGITPETPDPAQGVIDRDADGKPTGVLRDLAMNLITGTMPPPDEAEAAEAYKEGFSYFHSLGLTGVTDQRLMGGPEGAISFRIWQRLHAAGEIKLRVWMNLIGERLDEVAGLGLRTGFGDEYFRIGHLKFFADGALGTKTAWLLEPYEGTDTCGLPLTPIDEIAKAIRKATANGLAVAVHAIGDRANQELINVFEGLSKQPVEAISAPPLAPHRIEHLQVICPEDIVRLAKLNVVGSVQPLEATDDIPMTEPSIGARARNAYPFKTICDAGIPLTFNSDCPVCSLNPFWGMHAAVTRQRRDGTPAGGWYPDERVSVSQAVWSYSMGAAVVSGRQADLGSISPGKLADLVVVDRDIFKIEPEELFQAKALMTFFDGELVYEA